MTKRSAAAQSRAQAQAAHRVTEDQHKTVPLAPAYLTPGATEVWYEIMEAVPRDHFEAGDHRTLAAYCEACALVERLSPDCATEDPVLYDDDNKSKQNPFFTVFNAAISNVGQLAIRLKLAPSTRTKDSAGERRARAMIGAGRNSSREGLMFQGRKPEKP